MNAGKRVASIGIGISIGLALLKIVTGVLAGSRAVLADGCESGADVIASAMVWMGLAWAAKPPDENHPYGHGRAETLSGLILGQLLAIGGIVIIATSFASLDSLGTPPRAFAVWPLFISIGVKLWMMRKKRWTGRQIGSKALEVDAANDQIDVISGLVALVAVALALAWPERFSNADRYGAAAVGALMLTTGVLVARRTGADLMDTMPSDGFVARIRHTALGVPDVISVEKVLARRTGLRHHVDLHLWVDPDMTVRRSHELAHQVENRVVKTMPEVAEVLVHIEPAEEGLRGAGYGGDDPQRLSASR